MFARASFGQASAAAGDTAGGGGCAPAAPVTETVAAACFPATGLLPAAAGNVPPLARSPTEEACRTEDGEASDTPETSGTGSLMLLEGNGAATSSPFVGPPRSSLGLSSPDGSGHTSGCNEFPLATAAAAVGLRPIPWMSQTGRLLAPAAGPAFGRVGEFPVPAASVDAGPEAARANGRRVDGAGGPVRPPHRRISSLSSASSWFVVRLRHWHATVKRWTFGTPCFVLQA